LQRAKNDDAFDRLDVHKKNTLNLNAPRMRQ